MGSTAAPDPSLERTRDGSQRVAALARRLILPRGQAPSASAGGSARAVRPQEGTTDE
jgi:hypothetical protein